MKTIIRYLFLVAVLLTTASCTKNNGDIGDFFGAWVLRSMTVDGVEKSFPDDEYTTLRFQSSIAMFTLFVEEQPQYSSVSTWTSDDSMITFTFGHSDDNTAPGQGSYAPPAWLDMPQAESLALSISRLDRQHLDMVLNLPESKTIHYNFERTW